MAEIGNHSGTPDMDYDVGIASVVEGLRVTMPEANDGGSLSIWFYGTTDASTSITAAIYQMNAGADTLVTEITSAYAPGALTERWHELVMDSASLSAIEYGLVLYATAGDPRIAKETGGSITTAVSDYYNNYYSSGWVSSASPNPGDRDLSYLNYEIYLEYTAGGAGGTSNLLLLGVG